MKTKLCWLVLVMIAAGFIAAGGVYVARLASRTQALEGRLARVEAELNAQQTAGAPTAPAPAPRAPAALATQGTGPVFGSSYLWVPNGGQPGSLEERVEKIEKELTPHFEFLLQTKRDALEMSR
jgi:hypothetical protein